MSATGLEITGNKETRRKLSPIRIDWSKDLLNLCIYFRVYHQAREGKRRGILWISTGPPPVATVVAEDRHPHRPTSRPITFFPEPE